MSGKWISRKVCGERSLNAPATTWSATESLKEAFRNWPAKFLAMRAGTNQRTVENWKAGNNGPSWWLVVRMLHDEELAPVLLRAAGREDLADSEQILEKIRAAKRALAGLDQ
ncbi:hypothetical protein UFOVP860_37 [uncultured Caudovirales phage]|uniref:Uncharacterized protein n=1 Tax=uncultured Caudovirales phage TaxID=2100421 RepID=A0A6J5PCM3_9CAUD|nr:hypothetical protein UFOVP860_37 [uncultured Caudovirales phage]CAB4196030.1 hypothetical protein UFOVP1293_74 [uncultured Caudovirales phage]CAB4222643.1 hypothetical protein UFOVP1644_92 [uncultured Caudovirales phage]